jgi:outer membrane protein assembly factor BamB
VAGEEANPLSVLATDYVILTPRNRLITAEGKSGNVAFGGHVDQAAAIADTSIVAAGSRKADIDFDQEDFEDILGIRSSRSELISYRNDPGEKEIILGAGPGPSFGAVWFRDTRSIGGQRNFCSAGECQFGRGIRVFFTVKLTSAPTSNFEGEGFVFAISNGTENSVGSVGGDIEQGELLGYSGDSRTTSPEPPGTPTFLDGSGRGLLPPKIGLEFDTRVNFNADFEKTQNYCSGGDLRPDTRNDPLADDKHAVQYVFWGKEFLDLACRTTAGRVTYDDNRHDAVGLGSGNWAKALFGSTNSGPAVAADGAILVGSADAKLFAVNADGSEKWRFDAPAGEVYSPTLTASRAYVGSEDGKIYAVSLANGNKIWEVNRAFPVRSKPAVDGDGFVYVSAGNSLAKIDPGSGTTTSVLALSFDATSSPALSRDRLTVYNGFADNKLYARRTSDLTPRWTSPVIGSIQGEMAVAADDFIFAGGVNGLFKIDPSDGSIAAGPFFPGAGVKGSPALSRDGQTVYAGFGNGKLYALNTTDLSVKWSFPASGTIGTDVGAPVVDDNENIYAGSDNGTVYALFADGSVKWEFPTGGPVRARPAVDRNGVVYAGSDGAGGQLWAVNQFAEPRNYRENLQNVPDDSQWAKNLVAYSAPNAVNPYFSSITSPNKWLRDGIWAVRFEIDRVPLSGGRAEFFLRAWVQQCTDANCTNVRGTFFEDTRVRYSPAAKPPNLVQSFELDGTRNAQFNTFLFGFSTAKSASDDQLVTIGNFKLSFSRPGDPQVNTE